jgi:hypothetical protein
LENKTRIAILGGGPSGLFMFKRLVDTKRTDITIDIFEKKHQLGVGLPYSKDGANDEHITNVSGNEIPELVTSVTDWIAAAPKPLLDHFNITPEKYNDYKVLPRLLFGQYLSAQFELLKQKAKASQIPYKIYFESTVTDIIDYPEQNITKVEIANGDQFEYDQVVVCTGHRWPVKYEGKVPGYFDSPYPPAKLSLKLNHPVAVKGASLTAIDAVRTLARANGTFIVAEDGHHRTYQLADDSTGFKMIMHSRNGLLPAVRFHLEDPHLSKDATLSIQGMQCYRKEHDGFLSLDYLFEQDFKEQFRDKRPEFYERIKDMNLEKFVNTMMDLRESIPPFDLFKAEYIEAEKSIKQHHSVYWKEMLAILSFTMNYPAKYLPAEDMLRLQKVLMPLISIVIAFVPQSSAEEMMALHQAGVLEIISVGDDSYVEPEDKGGATYFYDDEAGKAQAVYFKTFVDCVGQPHLRYEDLPYKSLVDKQTVSPARLRFKDAAEGKALLAEGNKEVEADDKGNYYLRVPGIAINDDFQPVDNYGALNERIYMMAVPYIGGFNPDYSGLDFCEASSERIIKSMFR